MFSIFPLWISIYIFKQHPVFGVHISQLKRHSRACGSYKDFLDRGLLLTRKLLNRRFQLVKLYHYFESFAFVTTRSLPHSWLITRFVTRLTWWAPELTADTRSLVWCVCFVVCPFVLFLLAIVLSLLQFTDSDYAVGIFNLFFLLSIILHDGDSIKIFIAKAT